jgi:hypothetical protein
LEARDIQLVEVQGTTAASALDLKVLSNGDLDENVTSSARKLSPLVGFGTTNLAGLCGIGKYASQNNLVSKIPC